MVSLGALWMPLLLSGGIVFLASFVLHMVLPFHRADFRTLPAEDEVLEALRRFNLPPGDYMAPKADGPADLRSPAFQDKMNRGPVFVATVMPPGRTGMGAQLAQWFLFCLVVSLFAGYLGSRALPVGAPYLKVSQIVSTTAFMGYVLARWSDVIWFKRSLGTMFRATIDGLIYGLLTGGVFGWLWPR